MLVMLLLFRCYFTAKVLRLFLTVPELGLQCVIVVFPDHTHLLLGCFSYDIGCHLVIRIKILFLVMT